MDLEPLQVVHVREKTEKKLRKKFVKSGFLWFLTLKYGIFTVKMYVFGNYGKNSSKVVFGGQKKNGMFSNVYQTYTRCRKILLVYILVGKT